MVLALRVVKILNWIRTADRPARGKKKPGGNNKLIILANRMCFSSDYYLESVCQTSNPNFLDHFQVAEQIWLE